MRITYVLPTPELNGGNKVIFQHAELLRQRGHRVTLLGEGPTPDWVRSWVPYHDLGEGVPELPEQDLVVATYWTTLPRALELGRGPVAHFCQGYEGGLVHLAPVIGEIEAVYSTSLPTLTVSPHLAEMLARRFGRACRVVPPPLDPDFRPAWRWRPRRRPWLAIPGIFPAAVKDVPTALAAVDRLAAAGIEPRVLRLSTWPLEDDELRLRRPDRYLSGVPPRQVARALRDADLMLFASRAEEGFGLPVLEAMVSGVPVVASRIPSIEAFAAGAATLVPPGDAAAFADAASALLADPAAWRRARAAGLEAARRFAPERVAPVLEEAVRWARGAAGEATRRRPAARAASGGAVSRQEPPAGPRDQAVIRDYHPGDEVAINRAFNRTFGADRALAEWEWKFPLAGGRDHIVVAVAGGEVLAHFAVEAVTVQVDGRPVAAGHAVDAFARPGGGLARRGLYVRTVERFYATHGGEDRLRFLYGFPGGRHLALGRRLLGYQEPLPVAFFRRHGLAGATTAAERRSLADRLARRAVVAEPNLAADDRLWARARHRYPVAVVRDGARLARRFGGRPEVTYHRRTVWRRGEPRAGAVFRVDGRLLRWTELVWDGTSARDLAALEAAVAAAAGGLGAEVGELWLGGDPRASELLGRRGWRRERHPEDLHLTAVALDHGGGDGGGDGGLDVAGLVPRFYTTLGDSDLA